MLEGSGFKYESATHVDKVPEFDERSGNHLWIMTTAYQVHPDQWDTNEKVHFDMENLILAVGPGCFYCEQPFSHFLAKRRCKGKP